jgi:hypothetical protein
MMPRDDGLRLALSDTDSSNHQDPKPDLTEVAPPKAQASPKARQGAIRDILQTGGDWVAKGIQLPQLKASWNIADLIALATQGYGMIVAEWQGKFYRTITSESRLQHATRFFPLTAETRGKLSNRSFPLNLRVASVNGQATSTPYLLQRLERNFQRFMNIANPDDRPVWSFFATGSFDAYLARKQLGALVDLGLMPISADRASLQTVTTVGVLAVNHDRPLYLIRKIHVGSDIHQWQDPESALIDRHP